MSTLRIHTLAAAAAVLGLAAAAGPAAARDHGHGGFHGGGGHVSGFVGVRGGFHGYGGGYGYRHYYPYRGYYGTRVFISPFYDPFYAFPYYSYAPVYVSPPPVVVEHLTDPAAYPNPAAPYASNGDGLPPQPPAAAQSAPGQSAQGPCREFHTSIVIDGKKEPSYGTACRQADGTWKIVSP